MFYVTRAGNRTRGNSLEGNDVTTTPRVFIISIISIISIIILITIIYISLNYFK